MLSLSVSRRLLEHIFSEQGTISYILYKSNNMEVAQPEKSGEEYLIDILRDRSIPLEQIILVKSQPMSDDMVSSLQVQSLVSLIDNDITSKPEPENIIIDTCAYLINIMQEIYKTLYHQKDNLVIDQVGMKALQKALSVRIKALPEERKHNIDGCTSILNPTKEPDQPSTMVKDFKFFMAYSKKMMVYLREEQFTVDDGSGGKRLMNVDELRKVAADTGKFLPQMAFHIMSCSYSFEDCRDAFSRPDNTSEDEFINNFAAILEQKATDDDRDITKDIIFFAGVVRALQDTERQNIDYEEEEFRKDPDNYDDNVYNDRDRQIPRKGDIYYGIQLGVILHHIEEYAKEILKKPPAGSAYSHPRARFHQDMSKEAVLPKGDNVALTPQDVSICRSKHEYVEDESFGEVGDSVYSALGWSHDGHIGFTHIGAGYKSREFFGHIYSFVNSDGDRQIKSHELANEFWSTPSNFHADATNDTVWVKADERIKGFSVDRGNRDTTFYTSYIFQMADERQLKAIQPRVADKNSLIGGSILAFGSERLGYLDNCVLQEWKLNDTNRHDGTIRMVDMCNVEDDIEQWPAEDVLNLSDNTWMDDSGSAEVTRGKKPDSMRLVGIENPTFVGYLSDYRLALVDYSQIPIYNTELREISRLIGFGSDDGVQIVHRPTFDAMGEENVFVASDKTCVKIFDLRTAKAEMTIHQECLHSTPIPVNGNMFLCNKLEDGRAQMWDLRAQRALYSLPVSRDAHFVWVPAEDKSPAAFLTSDGECYMYGKDYDQDDEWEKKSAVKAWAKAERSSSGGDCSIM